MKNFLRWLLVVWVALPCLTRNLHSQISITGVTDQQTYTDQASFQIGTQAGYTYAASLNGKAVPTGVSVVVETMDHYELVVSATPEGGPPTTQIVQFIVLDSDRGSPEKGLIKWVPYPPIPSTAAEFAGAKMKLIAPASFPKNLPVPVIAWVEDESGNMRRANGTVQASGFENTPLPVRRGTGFTLLSPATNGGPVSYDGQLQTLSSNKVIQIEDNTVWTDAAGSLIGNTFWNGESRIRVTGSITVPAGSTLEIEAGAIVVLSPLANITVNGRVVINGTTANPVVFTSTNKVAPEQHAGAWGGFLIRNAGAELIANGAIFTGSGGASSFNFSPGASHRSEQATFLVHSGARAALTNCYVINNAGQIGNGYNSDVTYDHCLLQKAITAGEYVGGTIIVNHSAIIEFPSVDDKYDADIVDSDYDGIYFTTGTHILLNSLFGWAKDDAIDSGSGGAGTVVVSNCWVESTLHEALAWSGGGRQTWTYDTILINNGQGIECGWSDSASSPICLADRLLSTGNSVGARFGDNYDWTYSGFLTVSNSLLLNNYRDVWGRNWDDWTYRAAQMDIQNNHLTRPNTMHPNNRIWNASTDGDRLVPFMRVPANAPVGIGLALWSASKTVREITNGIPVRLSTFTPEPVSVEYVIEGPGGPVSSGTLEFVPGETVKIIASGITSPQSHTALRVSLRNPLNGEITGMSEAWYVNPPVTPPPTTTTLLARGAVWKYLDTGVNAGTAWRALDFDDSAWASGAAELGYGDGDEATTVSFGPNSAAKYITTYFRRAFNVADPVAYENLQIWLLRDDAGVVYVNGTEVFRSPNLPTGAIAYNTLAVGSAPPDDTIDTATVPASVLRTGNNVAAVEIHQQALNSSDLSFNFELLGAGATPRPQLAYLAFGDDYLLYWGDSGFVLEGAETITGPWTTVSATSPLLVSPSGQSQFFRLRK